MCIFARPVLAVGDTTIFARRGEGDSQFLVYRMSYHSKEANAMILPLPVKLPATEDSVRFIDLKEVTDFFNRLDRGFPHVPRYPAVDSMGISRNGSLKVVDVGDYIASFVPCLEDFSRLDPQFVIPKSTWDKIPEYANYGFAVFQLKPGEVPIEPHPMAFEFDSETSSVFFPTMHIHDGEVHKRENFDHVLYTQGRAFDQAVGNYVNDDVVDPATNWVRSKHRASRFCNIESCQGIVDGDMLVHRSFIKGMHPNQDVMLDLASVKTNSTFGFMNWKIWTPLAAGAAGLTWLFGRRNEVSVAGNGAQPDREKPEH